MTKNIERDIEDLKDSVLTDLPADERVQRVIEAEASDVVEHRDTLVNTVPTNTYRGKDHRYTNRMDVAHTASLHATYELHTSFLAYREALAQSQANTWQDLALGTGEDDEEYEPGDRDFQSEAEAVALTNLYVEYEAWRRFAEEDVGVDMADFLSFTTSKYPGLDAGGLEELVEDYLEAGLIRAGQTIEQDGEEVTVDPVMLSVGDEELRPEEAIDVVYELAAAEWNDVVGGEHQ